MNTIDTIILIGLVLTVLVMLYCAVKISQLRLRKYWSWWEKFNRSKEFMPTPPIMEFTPENKKRAIRFLKLWVYTLIITIGLAIIFVNRTY